MLLLHGYWRSGTAYRVRIALNLKGLAYDQVTHDLRKGEHRAPVFRNLQPQGLVPALEADGDVLIQSPAILEWLEERYPSPPLLPSDIIGRATVRAMASIIGCDIHPLNNMRVLTSLKEDLAADEEQVSRWIARWITSGFEALETMIARHGGRYAYHDAATLADAYLVPQVNSAERLGVDLSRFPHIRRTAATARAHPAFAAALPQAQPDAPGAERR